MPSTMDNFNDPKTWDLIQKGQTIGCFQIHTGLGRQWCKKISPENIEQLSALISVIRPGCLEVIIDGKSVPQKYADRKNGLEEIEYKYNCLKSILQNTLGLMIYQESAIRIVRDIAGFSLEEADLLRRAIGHKETETMAKARTMFIEGCKKTGIVNETDAIDIFDMIEKSQRYSFNVAHGISYAMLAYDMAYHKAHYPMEFFCGNLRFSEEKSKPLDQYAILVSDCKNFDVEVCVPDIRDLKENFYIKNNKIYYGLSNVKSVGASGTKLAKLLSDIDLNNISWYEFLRDYSSKINKTAITNLISVGAFDFLGLARNRMIYEYELYNKLTSKEQEWLSGYEVVRKKSQETMYVEEEDYRETMLLESLLGDEEAQKEYQEGMFIQPKPLVKTIVNKYSNEKEKTRSTQEKTLLEALVSLSRPKSEGGGCANKNRVEDVLDLIKTLENPPYSLDDTPGWIAQKEKELLGISITFHSVDDCDTQTANCTCKDFLSGYNNNSINIAVELSRVSEYTTTKGKNPGQLMAFITGSDSSAQLDCITCFPAEYATFKELLVEGNTVVISGTRSKQNSLVVKAVHQI